MVESVDYPQLIAGRYQVEKILGRGGMAVVYQAYDTHSGIRLALKQLLKNQNNKNYENIVQYFEYEFYTLSQLDHPCVIKVYNFGRDDTQPYYSMELLDGSNLHALAPYPWKRSCKLLIDVCSALSFLHSRQQVHRDLTPRNIHCTRDEKAKLIDFGALIPMGLSKHAIGTPAYTAPEVLDRSYLDARTDLFSLGATLYYLLTGHNAYPAKSFVEARSMWCSKPLAPSRYVAGIPKALDELTLALITIDPMSRPVCAAEVMERLSAIAGVELDDQIVVSQSYLSTPTLVGRDKQLLRAKKQITQALNGYGSTVTIEGKSGTGRSRFLDACVLEGKVAGANVLRVDATDAFAGNWNAIRELGLQLLEASPKLALDAAQPNLSLLAHVLPELLFESNDTPTNTTTLSSSLTRTGVLLESQGEEFDRFADIWGTRCSQTHPSTVSRTSIGPVGIDISQELRPKLQAALCSWFVHMSRERCLILTVDDIHRIDEPSASVIALLTHEVSRHMIVIAVTFESDVYSSSKAFKYVLNNVSYRIEIKNLNAKETKKLLSSMFGEANNLRIVADRVQTISQGTPRTIMQISRHLVERQVIRYQAGVWLLPSHIDTNDLPRSISEALRIQLQKLGSDTLTLAQTMALNPEHRYVIEECLLLTAHRNTARLIHSLNELTALAILSTDGRYYSFNHRGWVSVLVDQINPQKSRKVHLQLAAMFEKRVGNQFLVAQHLFRAGEVERGLDTIVDFSESSKRLTSEKPAAYLDLIESLPPDWYHTLTGAIQTAKQLERQRKDIYILQRRLSGLATSIGRLDSAHFGELIQQLKHDSGLVIYHELDNSIAPKERLKRSLELAQQRYDSTPESDRVLAPGDAIRELARILSEAVSMVYNLNDLSFWQSLPSLEPFIPLSPAIIVVEKLVQATGYLIQGYVEQSCQLNKEIIGMLDQSDHAGLTQTHYQYMRYGLYIALGLLEAGMGLDTALTRCSELESSPLFQIYIWRIRMLYYLWQGSSIKADDCKKQIELLKIQNIFQSSHLSKHLLNELFAYCLSDNLLEVKRSIDKIEKIVEMYPGWITSLYYARSEYQRIRGDYANALILLKEAMKLSSPGKNRVWMMFAATYINNLLATGCYKEAQTKGREFLHAAEKAKMGYLSNYLRMAFAQAEAKMGNYDNAIRQSQAAIDSFISLGTTGLSLGLAYESRAWVAIFMSDRNNFITYAKLCAEQYLPTQNPKLIAKYEKLIKEAFQAKLEVSSLMSNPTHTRDSKTSASVLKIVGVPQVSKELQIRSKRALKILVNRTNCLGAFLYTVDTQGTVLSALYGRHMPPAELDEIVHEYLSFQTSGILDKTLTCTEERTFYNDVVFLPCHHDHKYFPILLGHHSEECYSVTGLVIFLIDSKEPFDITGDAVMAASKVLNDVGDIPLVYSG